MEKCFLLSRPGKYTVVARYETPLGDIFTGHTGFELKPREQRGDAVRREEREKDPVLAGRFSADARLEGDWRSELAIAGNPHDSLTLDALVSPVEPRAVNLVVSLTNVGTTVAATPHWVSSDNRKYFPEDGVPISIGLKASDYQVLLWDGTGRKVPMTAQGTVDCWGRGGLAPPAAPRRGGRFPTTG